MKLYHVEVGQPKLNDSVLIDAVDTHAKDEAQWRKKNAEYLSLSERGITLL